MEIELLSSDNIKIYIYEKIDCNADIRNVVKEYIDKLKNLVPRGFSAGVYTQPTDVEIEVNGLMTYDRKVVKVDEKRVRESNKALINSLVQKHQ